MIKFSDAFSYQVKDYGKYRPTYPDALFKFLANLVDEHKDVWDCATGTGQAALSLQKYFGHVHATDSSEDQIFNAVPHPKVHYSLAPAEASNLPDDYVSMVTVAQSLHLFDMSSFYKEVDRVVKKNGIIAAWAYTYLKVNGNDALNELTQKIRHETLKPYMDPKFKTYWDHYQNVDFPYEKVHTPEFEVEVRWSLSDLMGYIASWHATECYRKDNKGQHPARKYWTDYCDLWGDDPEEKKTFRAPLIMLVGRKIS